MYLQSLLSKIISDNIYWYYRGNLSLSEIRDIVPLSNKTCKLVREEYELDCLETLGKCGMTIIYDTNELDPGDVWRFLAKMMEEKFSGMSYILFLDASPEKFRLISTVYAMGFNPDISLVEDRLCLLIDFKKAAS